MAGGGGGDEESYWPGFVDALTTMTMVLTFIMMVMGLVIFSLSQNVSRAKLVEIAQAMKIDPQANSLDQLHAKIISAIGEAQNVSSAQSAAQSSSQSLSQAIAKPEASAAQPAAVASKAAERSSPAKSAAASAQAAASAAASAPRAVPEARAATADSKAEQGGKTEQTMAGATMPENQQGSAGESPVRSTIKTEDAKAEKASSSGAEKQFRIMYADRNFQIDDPVKVELDGFLARAALRERPVPVEVKAFAKVGMGAVSEARRVAYYRGMIVRQQLVGAGISADRIRIKVEDADNPDDANSVQISAN
jgi:hypothetical protein